MSWGITMAIMAVLSVAVAVYIAWPLLVGRPDEEREGAEGEGASVLDALLVQKDATYSAIKELESDHAMGNLSAQDYRELARTEVFPGEICWTAPSLHRGRLDAGRDQRFQLLGGDSRPVKIA